RRAGRVRVARWDRDRVPTHRRAAVLELDRGKNMGADRLIGIADRHWRIKQRLHRLADIEPVVLAADEYRYRIDAALDVAGASSRLGEDRFFIDGRLYDRNGRGRRVGRYVGFFAH